MAAKRLVFSSLMLPISSPPSSCCSSQVLFSLILLPCHADVLTVFVYPLQNNPTMMALMNFSLRLPSPSQNSSGAYRFVVLVAFWRSKVSMEVFNPFYKHSFRRCRACPQRTSCVFCNDTTTIQIIKNYFFVVRERFVVCERDFDLECLCLCWCLCLLCQCDARW